MVAVSLVIGIVSLVLLSISTLSGLTIATIIIIRNYSSLEQYMKTRKYKEWVKREFNKKSNPVGFLAIVLFIQKHIKDTKQTSIEYFNVTNNPQFNNNIGEFYADMPYQGTVIEVDLKDIGSIGIYKDENDSFILMSNKLTTIKYFLRDHIKPILNNPKIIDKYDIGSCCDL